MKGTPGHEPEAKESIHKRWQLDVTDVLTAMTGRRPPTARLSAVELKGRRLFRRPQVEVIESAHDARRHEGRIAL